MDEGRRRLSCRYAVRLAARGNITKTWARAKSRNIIHARKHRSKSIPATKATTSPSLARSRAQQPTKPHFSFSICPGACGHSASLNLPRQQAAPIFFFLPQPTSVHCCLNHHQRKRTLRPCPARSPFHCSWTWVHRIGIHATHASHVGQRDLISRSKCSKMCTTENISFLCTLDDEACGRGTVTVSYYLTSPLFERVVSIMEVAVLHQTTLSPSGQVCRTVGLWRSVLVGWNRQMY